jgi:hypothetical protein
MAYTTELLCEIEYEQSETASDEETYVFPPMDPALMMRPQFRAIMCGVTAFGALAIKKFK